MIEQNRNDVYNSNKEDKILRHEVRNVQNSLCEKHYNTPEQTYI